MNEGTTVLEEQEEQEMLDALDKEIEQIVAEVCAEQRWVPACEGLESAEEIRRTIYPNEICYMVY